MLRISTIGERRLIKYGYTTHAVPLDAMSGYVPMRGRPEIGDLLVAEVLSLGKHTKIEARSGVQEHIFPGDLVVGSFGNRYATDQYEGYTPRSAVEVCDMLSIGGVCGELASSHDSMTFPTKLRVLGHVSDASGRPINQRDFGLPAVETLSRPEVIAVVGSSMNSGKTTTVGTVVRALRRAGYDVAAAKVTGTACKKDLRFFESCGADPALDFVDAGYPSTYMVGFEELLEIHHNLLSRLRASNPDYVVIEIADGILQRETALLLGAEAFCDDLDHLLFASGDSLSIESGTRLLTQQGLPLRATSGAITRSELAAREAEEATGMPCLSIDRIMAGELLQLLKPAALTAGERLLLGA